jgi:hypothetical protein
MTAGVVLQEALYGALAGDGALRTLVSGIYDFAPEDAALPFVQIGEAVVNDWSAAEMAGEEHLLTLHVWSQARGHLEAKSIMAAVAAALEDGVDGLDGHHLVDLRLEMSEVLLDGESFMHHGVMRFRALTQRI